MNHLKNNEINHIIDHQIDYKNIACNNMQEVRFYIDELDSKIVELLANRSYFVSQAAQIKQNENQIVDLNRVEFIIQKVRAQAEELHAPADLIEKTYRALINASIEFEHSLFKQINQKNNPNSMNSQKENQS